MLKIEKIKDIIKRVLLFKKSNIVKYKKLLTGEIGFEGKLDRVFIEATYKRILKDILFFMNQSRKCDIKREEKNRYARIAILLIAFYIESLSNLLFDDLVQKPLNNLDTHTNLPKPIRRFRAVYKQIYQSDLPLNTNGIQDLFTIRNKVIAHPGGKSKEKHSEISTAIHQRSRLDKEVRYLKFRNFPTVYSQFTISHAEDILKEVKNFLINFHKKIKYKVFEKKILDALWPTELI